MQKPFEEILSDVEFLLRSYAGVKRATANPYRLAEEYKHDPSYIYMPEDFRVQETLMEHVGTLPVLASYFHQYVEERVDLGRVLEMLSVHDAGELVIGDVNTFIKKEERRDIETKEALKILNPKLHGAYLEYQASETNEAKFAKSIDKIAPDFLDMFTPKEMTIVRLKHYANFEPGDIVAAIEKHKSPHMQWSGFFREFHAELIKKLKTVFGNS